MRSKHLIRTTIRLSPQTIKIVKEKSLAEKISMQEMIEKAIKIVYKDKPKSKRTIKTGVHNLNLGIKEGVTFSRDEIYSYLDEKF